MLSVDCSSEIRLAEVGVHYSAAAAVVAVAVAVVAAAAVAVAVAVAGPALVDQIKEPQEVAGAYLERDRLRCLGLHHCST